MATNLRVTDVFFQSKINKVSNCMKVIQDIINELFFKNHIAIKVKIVFLAVVNSIFSSMED